MEPPVEFLMKAFDLKDETRTGWVLRDITAPESVADHSWGTALLCLVYGPEAAVDVQRSLAMAIVHDLAEAVTGDVARRVDPAIQSVSEAEKAKREEAAMETLLSSWPSEISEYLGALWREYEERATEEARFVRDMNLVDMCLQALKYEQDRRYIATDPHPNFPGFSRLDEFFETSGPRLSTEVGKRAYMRARAAYEEARDGRSP